MAKVWRGVFYSSQELAMRIAVNGETIPISVRTASMGAISVAGVIFDLVLNGEPADLLITYAEEIWPDFPWTISLDDGSALVRRQIAQIIALAPIDFSSLTALAQSYEQANPPKEVGDMLRALFSQIYLQ